MKEDFSGAISILKSVFPSRELSDEGALTHDFIVKSLESGHQSFDLNDFNVFKNDVHKVENRMYEFICQLNNIESDGSYVSLYRHEMNANAIGNYVVFDELLIYTIISFYSTVFSLVDDNSNENLERCIKTTYVLLDLQGIKREIGHYNTDELQKMLGSFSDIMMHRTMDCVWVTWAFLVSHELYHIQKGSPYNSYEEELEADAYAYKTIINLIMTQKDGKVPEDIKVFYEETYLAPIMLFNYFELLDIYCNLCGREVLYSSHPSPKERQNQIFNLFDDYIPDDMETFMGNEVLNTFLEISDTLKSQISYKKKLGKI